MAVLGWRAPAVEAASPRVLERHHAIARGLPRYFTGQPCKAGHVAERLTIDRTCTECTTIRQRKMREATRQALKEKTP